MSYSKVRLIELSKCTAHSIKKRCLHDYMSKRLAGKDFHAPLLMMRDKMCVYGIHSVQNVNF